MNDHDEETLASLQQANDQLMAKNHALVKALSRATQEMTKTKAQLNQLAGPPMTFATMVRVHSAKTDEQGVQHASAEVAAGARRMIVPIAANLQASRLEPGCSTRTWWWSHSSTPTRWARCARYGRCAMTAACWSRMAAAT